MERIQYVLGFVGFLYDPGLKRVLPNTRAEPDLALLAVK